MELFFKRRSIKPMQMTGEEIPRSAVEQILKAATMAANHKMTQPWRFCVLSGSSKLEFCQWALQHHQIKYPGAPEFNAHQNRFELIASKTSHIIALIFEPKVQSGLPMWEEIAAFGGAVQNLHLAATELGYSGLWSTSYPTSEVEIFDFLNYRPSELTQFYGFFFLGVPESTEFKAPKRLELDQVCTWKS